MKLKFPKTKAEARSQAIKWQQWASSRALSAGKLMEYDAYFASVARKFKLFYEFRENGII